MNERPPQPPEGHLIAAALEASGLSIREASKRAGISYGRWRQITSGVQNVSPGSYAAVRAPAKTLARMAAAAGVTPERLETEGQRPDAAEVLRELIRSGLPPASRAPSLVPSPAEDEPDDSAWKLFPNSPEKRAIWRLHDGDGRPLPERVRAELIAALDEAVAEMQAEERARRAGLERHARRGKERRHA